MQTMSTYCLRKLFALACILFVAHGNEESDGTTTSLTPREILAEKWTRIRNWIESEGGYIHPSMVLDYMHDDSFERALFTTTDIAAGEIMVQLPLTTILSQFIISKYIKNAEHHPAMAPAEHFMPESFPDWFPFLEETITDEYDYPTVEPWTALGFAWLRANTQELEPWLDLMPPDVSYLPIMWPQEKRLQLLEGTEALKIVTFNELVFNQTLPYIDMLGLTHRQVKEAFALMGSRAFGTDFSAAPNGAIGGEYMCAIDFGNHNRLYDSHVEAPMIEDKVRGSHIEEKLLNSINKEITEVEYSSIYWHLDNEFEAGDELFNNYGGDKNSAEMLALFGFIDSTLPKEEDYHIFQIEMLDDDVNWALKDAYFWYYWPGYDVVSKHPSIEYGASIRFNGDQYLYVENFATARIMRLAYLPDLYFDSFTISSIINGFERDYLKKVIDPFVEEGLHRKCWQKLEEYPTDYDDDEAEWEEVIAERLEVVERMKDENADRDTLQTQLWALETRDQILRYRMREKVYLMDCQVVQISMDV